MKPILSVVCCVALCSVPALAAQKEQAKAPVKGTEMSDQQFVDFAAQTDMVEANLGQKAQTVAATQQVKELGEALATDHTSDYNQLYAAAHQANLNVPDAIDSEHNKTVIDPFEKLKGEAFDHHYVADMVTGHEKAIAVYKKEATEGQNPALKSYAQQALPTLERHLDSAKGLEKTKAPAKGA